MIRVPAAPSEPLASKAPSVLRFCVTLFRRATAAMVLPLAVTLELWNWFSAVLELPEPPSPMMPLIAWA